MGLPTKSTSFSNLLQKYIFLSSLITMVPSCSFVGIQERAAGTAEHSAREDDTGEKLEL